MNANPMQSFLTDKSLGPDKVVGVLMTEQGERRLIVEPEQTGGGKLAGDHYYRVEVPMPISDELKPYVAECADIIEALGMTFNEGEAFKALWRLAAARQGRGKLGNKPLYDADKVAHYGARVAAHTRAHHGK
jgi:hypothetical protein